MKALFLDRDGTLIVDKHYLADPAGVELLPGAAEGLRRAVALGYRLYLLTNQSGIGRGYYTLDQAIACNQRMETLLGLPSPLFTEVCIAGEAPDQPSRYRKPSPAFILEKIAEHGLDPAHCYMVGDRESDVEAGLNAQVHAIAVCTGKLDAAGWAASGLNGIQVHADFGAFAATLR